MALLKSKAPKTAATTHAAHLLSLDTVDVLVNTRAQGSSADWTIAQLSAVYTEHRTQLVSQARRASPTKGFVSFIPLLLLGVQVIRFPDLRCPDRGQGGNY